MASSQSKDFVMMTSNCLCIEFILLFSILCSFRPQLFDTCPCYYTINYIYGQRGRYVCLVKKNLARHKKCKMILDMGVILERKREKNNKRKGNLNWEFEKILIILSIKCVETSYQMTLNRHFFRKALLRTSSLSISETILKTLRT